MAKKDKQHNKEIKDLLNALNKSVGEVVNGHVGQVLLINETNQQYYAGAQGFTVADPAGESTWTFTFDTDLILGSWDPTAVDYALNNFKLYTSPDGINYTEYITEFTLVGNTITLNTGFMLTRLGDI